MAAERFDVLALADMEYHAGHVNWCAVKLRQLGLGVAANGLDEVAELLRRVGPVTADEAQGHPDAAWMEACKEVFSTPLSQIRKKYGTGDLYAAVSKRANEIRNALVVTEEMIERGCIEEASDSYPYTWEHIPECVKIRRRKNIARILAAAIGGQP